MKKNTKTKMTKAKLAKLTPAERKARQKKLDYNNWAHAIQKAGLWKRREEFKSLVGLSTAEIKRRVAVKKIKDGAAELAEVQKGKAATDKKDMQATTPAPTNIESLTRRQLSERLQKVAATVAGLEERIDALISEEAAIIAQLRKGAA